MIPLGKLVPIPNTHIRHRAEDAVYFLVRVQFPHGTLGGRAGEEPWLLTDGDLRNGAAVARLLARRGGEYLRVASPSVAAGHVRFFRGVSRIEYNIVRLGPPACLVQAEVRRELCKGALTWIALTDSRLERIRQRVERNQEDLEPATAQGLVERLLDLLD